MKKPKLKKLKPKLPKRVRRVVQRKPRTAEQRMSEALQKVPGITNETVAEHREAVLGGARKYIYPLQHSKHHVVRISLGILAAAVVLFLLTSGVLLYKFQNTSGFMYGVTQVIPFPVAKAGSSWVSYESYLFELRRNMHYYQTQQQANFSTKDGKAQLQLLKQQAMNQVIQNAYVKQLASANHVSVSSQAVNNQVALVRSQNRLGSSQHVFNDVLNEFWGWNEADFKRELQQQMLQQAVVAKLDTATNARAAAAKQQLLAGTDFAALAKSVSDDAATKANGGQYPGPIAPNDANYSPIITAELFKLKPGQISDIINSGYSLDILKLIDGNTTSVHAAHIQFTLAPITDYVKPLQGKHPSATYIKF